MKRITHTIRFLILFIPRLLLALKFWSVHFNELIFQGGMSVDTPVPLKSPADKATTLRTVVQLDGDILNLLPSIELPVDNFDSNWNEVFQEASQQHLSKVRATCKNLEGFATIPQGVAAALGVVTSYMTIKSIPVEVNTIVLYTTSSICWIIFTYVSHFIFRKIVIKRLIEVFIKLRSKSFLQSLLKRR